MKKHSSWLLDPPERFGPLERWYSWLDDLRAMQPDYPDDPGIAREIAHVEKWLPKREELEPKLQALKAKAA
jgi:hypothetical protein